MSEPPLAFPDEIPAPQATAQAIPRDVDVRCVTCGYDLRGADAAGKCPECGTHVALSLHGNRLAYSDPTWVGRLGNAITLMIISTVAAFILSFISGVSRSPEFTAIITVANGVLSFSAMWLLTTPEPRAWMAEQNFTLRMALRIFSVLNFVSSLLGAANTVAPARVLQITTIAVAVTGLPAIWLYYLYLSRLALRLPEERLARQCRIVMWGITITSALGILGALYILAAGFAAIRGSAGLFLICPAALGMIIFGLWSFILLIRLRGPFSRAAEAARINFAQAPASPLSIPLPPSSPDRL